MYQETPMIPHTLVDRGYFKKVNVDLFVSTKGVGNNSVDMSDNNTRRTVTNFFRTHNLWASPGTVRPLTEMALLLRKINYD